MLALHYILVYYVVKNKTLKTKGVTKMTISQIARILEKHSINYSIIGNKIIADDEYTINGILHTDTLDMTDISKEQLYNWLGY